MVNPHQQATLFQINPGPPHFQRTGQPLYIQFADLLRQQIENGLLLPGSKLPNMVSIAAHFDIARVTVRQAVQLLVEEGFLTSRQGRGIHISNQLPSRNLQKLQTSWHSMLKRIEGANVELLEEAEMSACPLLEYWGLSSVDMYHFMRRVHIKDEVRFAYIEIYLDKEIFDRAPARFNSTTVIPVMDELNINIVTARQELTIGTASPDAAFHLKIPCGSPVAHVRRFACDERGKAVYAAAMVHPGDKVKFDIELIRKRH